MTLLTSIGKIFNPILDPIFEYLLKLPEFWCIFIITFLVSLVSVLIYKKLTDQKLLKEIKEELNKLKREMKSTKDTQKILALQKKSMELSVKQMKQTMKPMIATLLPILIIFAWLATHLAYYPLIPGEEFNVTIYFKDSASGNVEIMLPAAIELLDNKTKQVNNSVTWRLLPKQEGEYTVNFLYNNETYSAEVLITKKRLYKEPIKFYRDDVRKIVISNKPVRVFGLSWFWIYLILAVILNTLLRKLLKVY